MPCQKITWIENENERKDAYRKILASGDQAAIISMVQALFCIKSNGKPRENGCICPTSIL
jgi:hypothetical protein